MADFWDQFPDFTPQPHAKFTEQFNALAAHRGWSQNVMPRYLSQAIVAELDAVLGPDTSYVYAWRYLCHIVGVLGQPYSISECVQALSSPNIMVNIFDLIDHIRDGTPLKNFNNSYEFYEYTKGHRLPRGLANKRGFIRVLVRKIH